MNLLNVLQISLLVSLFSRVENFLGFEFLVRNEEIDGHSHEEWGIFEEFFFGVFSFKMIVKRFLSIINNYLLIIYSLKKTILPKVKLITNMEIQKIQKCMFLNLKLPKFCLKWLIFPHFFLASYSSWGIPRIEIPHSSFLIEGLTSLVYPQFNSSWFIYFTYV